nr:T9SS type A sorting domain-containing protein [Allomuricauda sp.]
MINNYINLSKRVKNNKHLAAFVLCLVLVQCVGLGQSPVDVAGTPTITASQSGNWSASSTWGGILPADDDRVLIPDGITVTVDGLIAEEFKSVRIAQGGKLQYATNVNTELRTEYLVSEMGGSFEIGTAANKVDASVTAKLVFAERGGTTQTFDPQRFAPGAVLMGPVRMHGADKTNWLAFNNANQPDVGATQLVLNSTPSGWRVGDKLALAGTDINSFTSDEVVEISGISGNVITLQNPLALDHKAPSQAADLDVHLANLTRNIVVTSENPSVTSISGEFRKPRGHMMFMHNQDVDLRFVEANNTGRTDKSIILDDWDFEDLARGQDTGSPVPNGGRNPRGRYSFHFHRGAVDTSVYPAKAFLPDPAHVEGCVVNNDPGWGFVNHSSRVNFVRNVSYDVVGSAFCTESGNETGSFIENIAIRTYNPTEPMTAIPRPRNSYFEGGPTQALADIREGRQDFAWQGDGFWFHGTGVTVEGNVVAGSTGHAYVYWVDGLIEKGLGMARGDIDAHVPAAEFPVLNQALKDWKAQYPGFVLDIWYLQPRPFRNNTAYTFARGVHTYYVHTEFHLSKEESNDPEEWMNLTPDVYRQQLNLVFDNTILWNIRRRGFGHNHTSNVTIQNSRVVGYNASQEFENYGTNPLPGVVAEEPVAIGIDLDFYHNTYNWTLINNTIEGFSGNAVGITTALNANVTIDGGTFNNSGTDIEIKNPTQQPNEDFPMVFDGGYPRVTIKESAGPINFLNGDKNIVLLPQLHNHIFDQDGFALLADAKEENWFFTPQNISFDFGPFKDSQVYYNAQDANYVPITTEARCTLENGDECIDNRYVGKANQQLSAQNNGQSFAGAITPITAIPHPMVVGGKVLGISVDGCPLDDLGQNNFDIKVVGETCLGKNNGSIRIGSAQSGVYNAKVNGVDYPFTEETQIGGLSPGNYELCISYIGATSDCQRCFEAAVTAGGEISGSTTLVTKTGEDNQLSVEIDKGTAPFTVRVNKEVVGRFNSKEFKVPVEHGDKITVTSDKACEGQMEYRAELYELIELYPNPVREYFTISVPSKRIKTIEVAIFSMGGTLIQQRDYQIEARKARVPTDSLIPGTYVVKVGCEGKNGSYKIIKK